MAIVGRSGSGKTLYAVHEAVTALTAGKQTLIFDYGRSYRGLAHSLAGTLVTVSEGPVHADTFGTMPLTVFDFGTRAGTKQLAELPGLPHPSPDLFILVDETAYVFATCPELASWIRQAQTAGAEVCVVLQALSAMDNLALAPLRVLEIQSPSR